jgi:hypothetical protein
MKNNLNDILFLMDEFTFSHNSELGEQDSEHDDEDVVYDGNGSKVSIPLFQILTKVKNLREVNNDKVHP